MSELPNTVVGERLPFSIGPLDAEINIHSYELEYTTVTYKPNVVHVKGTANVLGGNTEFKGSIEFSLSEDGWRDLNLKYE